ncbi:hypothetical protein F5148DRAFT_1350153 [Russula earlei]|uniref:Uncharacterized protein n=1 Tax=Russula earlei TaxID=71964 RepID=A0ACC0TSE5_9AGAM|nr:hypothetical protein F5148DRAFT_1350153 [Russula earlei]
MHAACNLRARARMEAMYGGNVWRQGSTVLGGGAIHRGGGGGEVRVGNRNIPCEGMFMCLMLGVRRPKAGQVLGARREGMRGSELHGHLQLRWWWHAWAIPAMVAAWSGSRGMGGKREFIGISIGGTGGIEMAIMTGAVGGMAGAKAAEVVAGNTVDRAEAPMDKAEMAAVAGDAGDAAVSWRTEVGMDEAKMEVADGEMAIIQSSVLLWHLGNILKLLESLLCCLGERDGTQQLHHLGKGHQNTLIQPRVRTRTLKMSICLVASSKQHFLFNLHPQQLQQELC